MLLIIKIEDLKYSNDINECLLHNISNPAITKIVIFSSLKNIDKKIVIDQKSRKVVLMKVEMDVLDMVKYAKKISKRYVIYSTPFIKFNNDLSSIMNNFDVKKIGKEDDSYYIFDKSVDVKDAKSLDDILCGDKISLNIRVHKVGYYRSPDFEFLNRNWNISEKFTNSNVEVLDRQKEVIINKIDIPVVEVDIMEDIITADLPINDISKSIENRVRKIDVVIVSVNYNDFLLISLEKNSKIFDNITVVTSSDDFLCHKICEKFEVNCLITDIMYEDGAVFNKGKAINEGIKSISNPDYILLLDADTVVLEKINLDSLDEEYFYSTERYMITNYYLYKAYLDGLFDIDTQAIIHSDNGLGYFQLFNYSKCKSYPESSNDASKSDLLFRDKFKKRSSIIPGVIHLGIEGVNWKGRFSDRFITDKEFFRLFEKPFSKYSVKSDANEWGVSSEPNIGKSIYGKLKIVNSTSFDYHNGGWSNRLKELSIINSENGVDFDCYLEKSYCWDNSIKPIYKKNWVGILHSPIDSHDWYLKKTKNIEIFECPEFLKSLTKCKGIYVFSEYEKTKVSNKLISLNKKIPVNCIRHTIDSIQNKWSYDKYSKSKRILHIGWWMRDIKSFYLLRSPIKKTRILLNDKIEDQIFKIFEIENTDVEEISNLNSSEYENMLSSSVVFINLIDGVANNTVLECIESNTPILVNKNPSVIEYLGDDYPLYYDSVDDIEKIISDKRLIEASVYLSKLDKSKILGYQIERSEIYESIKGIRKYELFNAGDFEQSLGGVYNPGFLRYNNQNVFFPRVEQFNELERNVNNIWKKTSALPILITVDDDFNIKSKTRLNMKNYLGNRIEDFRLFEHKGILYSNHVFVDKKSIYPVISKIVRDEMLILGKIKLDIEINDVEKNWIFVSIDEKLFLIYSVSPMMVFEIDLDKMKGTLVKNKKFDLKWSVGGYISNSTNPILLQDGNYLMGIHSRTDNLVYHQGFLKFDKDFNLINSSTTPYISGGDFDGINKGVIYTTSLVEKQNEIFCFCGDGDYKSIIIRINKDNLFNKVIK
jgi:hypothetical protein